MILEQEGFPYISLLQKSCCLQKKINSIKHIQESAENILDIHWDIQIKIMMSDILLMVQTNQENGTIKCQG